MTLHSIAVRHFQSLHDVTLDLQPFTVIVGPSSSGKSALTRALRTLVSNRRGTEWITHGERVASISATNDKGTVTLTRSRTTSSPENSYVITPADDPEAQRTYTKLGGDTPQDVSEFLGIPANNPLQFAGQFDKPFLLDDSAAEVARILGALTNVSIIFDGARESNRRKLDSAKTLRLRADDLDRVKARIPEFKNLRAQDDALAEAERLVTFAREIERRIARLTQALDTLDTLEPTISQLEAAAAVTVPDESRILRAQEALQSFQRTLSRVPVLAKAQQAAQAAYDAVEAEEVKALADYDALVASITDTLAGFLTAMVKPEHTIVDGDHVFIERGHVIEIMTLYLETKASA